MKGGIYYHSNFVMIQCRVLIANCCKKYQVTGKAGLIEQLLYCYTSKKEQRRYF